MIAIFPEIAAAAANGDLERLVVLVRKYFGGEDTYAAQPDISRLLRYAGVTISRLKLDCEAALLAKDEKGCFKIAVVINEALDEVTSRFTLAHLLGHFLLDLQPLIARGDCLTSGYREGECPLRRYSLGTKGAHGALGQERKELLSDDFAAALLMPKGMVLRAMTRLGDLERTANFFGVTKACLARRLSQVGFVEEQPVNFLHAEEKLGKKAAVVASSDQNQENSLLKAPLADASMPRSYAASSYIMTEKATAKAPEKPARIMKHSASEASSSSASPLASSGNAASAGESETREKAGQGMDRIRQLAKLLDKSMP